MGDVHVISILQVNLSQWSQHCHINTPAFRLKTIKGQNTHCKPNKLNVNRAIRADSFRPLIDGVPTHLAACGILLPWVPACT